MQNILKKLRNEHDLSQEELAKELGITRPAVSEIERGKRNPSGTTMIRIANFFGIPAEQIFFDQGVNHAEQSEQA